MTFPFLVAVAVGCSSLVAAAADCTGEYELCPLSGECVLDSSWCGVSTCAAGEYLCPGGSGSDCAPSAAALLFCKNVPPIYNWTLPLVERVRATVALLTLEEKAALIVMVTPGVPRLSIPAMNWWTEAQHGVGIDGKEPASSGPATGALASSWSPDLFRRMAEMAALEARGRHNAAVHAGNRQGNQVSLTTFSPEMNLVRTPLWGRVQESVGGEDPYLSALHAAAFVRGLQAEGAAGALLTTATCKDFIVYDWETNREAANVTLTARDIAETYLPPWIGCVAAANAAAVMLTYYAVQLPGQAAATSAVVNSELVNGLLRGGLGRDGDAEGTGLLVMCDCDAIADLVLLRHAEPDDAHASAAALLGGTDMELDILPGGGCSGQNKGFVYAAAADAVRAGLLPEAVLDAAVARGLTVRVRLGLFDPPTTVPYNALTNDTSNVLSAAHVSLTRALAAASAILLQNRGGALPLRVPATGSVLALLGPAIDDAAVMLGDYADMAAPAVSIAAAAAVALPGVTLAVARGCANTACNDTAGFAAAAAAAAGADAVVLQLGLCSDACKGAADGGAQEAEERDRAGMGLPGQQVALALAVRAAARPGAPLVCVLLHGGAVDVSPVLPACDAVVSFGYPGMQGGPAVWDTLLGAAPPAGRTALTWYTDAQALQLAPPTDYDMHSGAGLGRTYRFFNSTPLFPFGFGLSYTSWTYANLTLWPPSSTASPLPACTPLAVDVTLCNTGGADSDEVAQVYVATPDGPLPAPRVRLAAYRRVARVAAGACVPLRFALPPPAWTAADDGGALWTQAGRLRVSVGGGQPDFYAGAQTATAYAGPAAPLADCGPTLEQLKAYYTPPEAY